MTRVSSVSLEAYFLRVLDPTRGICSTHMASRCEAYLFFDVYKRFHSRKVLSEDLYRKTELDGGWSSNVLWLL